MKSINIFVFLLVLLLSGCLTQSPKSRWDISEFSGSMFPFGPEYVRVKDLSGEWVQCNEGQFYSKAYWGYGARVSIKDDTLVLTVRPWIDDLDEVKYKLFTMFFERDDFRYSSRMFKMDDKGLLVFTMKRKGIYMLGATRDNIVYLSIGIFDPPLFFVKEKDLNQTL